MTGCPIQSIDIGLIGLAASAAFLIGVTLPFLEPKREDPPSVRFRIR
jgi:hypothetical protein